MQLFSLFLSFLQIGTFSFGGGMASIPLVQEQVVNLHQWLSLTEFADLVTIAEMTPGPIAVNAATFVGLRIFGFSGAAIATIACILPSCLLLALLSCVYTKYKNHAVFLGIMGGLRPAVVALIAGAGLSMLKLAVWGENAVSFHPSSINLIAVLLFLAAFFVLRKWKPNPIFVMLGTGVIGGILYLLFPIG